MEEETIVERLPDKSRSLRKTSVKKRLQTELNKKTSKVKDNVSKKRKLTKYRRKAANAKERERMKKMNDVFATLKSVIPSDKKDDLEEEKETKVTTLRSAIHYINFLKQLLKDCDNGLLDKNNFNLEDAKISEQNIVVEPKLKESSKKKNVKKKICKPLKSLEKSRRPIILDKKWTNYSSQFLEHKFSIPKDENEHQIDISYPNSLLHPLPDISTFNQTNHYTTSSFSSPRDVNEISLHISLLESENIIDTDNYYLMQYMSMTDQDLIENVTIENIRIKSLI